MKYIPGINLTSAHLPDWDTSTLHVDGGRTDVYSQNGTVTKPFKTITAALAVANDLFGDDDSQVAVEVKIAAGIYAEEITYTIPGSKKRLVICGAGQFVTKIQSIHITNSGTDSAANNDCVIDINMCTIGLNESDRTTEVLKIQRQTAGRILVNFNNIFVEDNSDTDAITLTNTADTSNYFKVNFHMRSRIRINSNAGVDAIGVNITSHVTGIFLGTYFENFGAGTMINLTDGSYFDLNMSGAYGGDKFIVADSSTVNVLFTSVQSWREESAIFTLANGTVFVGTEMLIESTASGLAKIIDETTPSAAKIGNVGWSGGLGVIERINVSNLILGYGATQAGFEPAVPGDWTTAPTTVQQALDELAAR